MKPRQAAFLLLALTLSGSISLPANENPGGTFTFFVLADPQMGMFAENRDFIRETENMEKAVAACNRLKPSFVVVLGDLVNREGDEKQIAEYLRLVRRIDPAIPVYPAAGNHDLGNVPTAASLQKYRERFGPDYFAFEVQNTVGIVLDSSLIKVPGEIKEERDKQKAWLEGELRKARGSGKRVLLFQHIPWCLDDIDEPEKYENIGPEARREYLALFASSTVSHIFAGHRHMNGQMKIGAIEQVITGPVGKALGPDPSGLLIVTVGPNGLSRRYVSLDLLPLM